MIKSKSTEKKLNWFITVDHDASHYVATFVYTIHFFLSSTTITKINHTNKRIIWWRCDTIKYFFSNNLWMPSQYLLAEYSWQSSRFFRLCYKLRLHKSVRFSLPQSSSFKMLNKLLLLLQIVLSIIDVHKLKPAFAFALCQTHIISSDILKHFFLGSCRKAQKKKTSNPNIMMMWDSIILLLLQYKQ